MADVIAYDVNQDGEADVIESPPTNHGIDLVVRTGDEHEAGLALRSSANTASSLDINGDGLKDRVAGKRFWSHGKSEAASNKPARLSFKSI